MICLACGNTEDFVVDAIYREWVREEQIVDGETGEVVDYGESKTEESEWRDFENLICRKCHSSDVGEGLTEEEVLERQVRHIDNDGYWNKDELPPKERNEVLAKKLMAMKI